LEQDNDDNSKLGKKNSQSSDQDKLKSQESFLEPNKEKGETFKAQ